MIDFGESRIKIVGLIEGVVLYLLLVLRFPEEGPEVFLSIINFVKGLLLEPFYPFAFLPESVLDSDDRGVVCLIHGLVYTEAVLLSAHPLAHVDAAVGPLVNTIAMLFIILILTHVATPISPSIHTHSMHVVIKPFSLKLSSVKPAVCAKTFYFVFVPLALVL